jgi:hypothetical protein
MTEPFEKAGQDAAAFQKLCLDSFSKALQAAFAFTPGAAPPEILRDIRTGIFKALAESWDEFLRSPQFLDTMRQWMDNAIVFRKVTDEFLGRARNELQAPSRNDLDNVILAVRHMEKRLLDRLDELAAEWKSPNQEGQSPSANLGTRSRQRPQRRPKTPGRATSSRRRKSE